MGLAGCAPVEGVLDVQPHAIDLSEGGCIRAEGRPIGIGEALTLEAWIVGGVLPIGAKASLVTLDDVATLWLDTDGNVGLSTPAQVGEDGFSGQHPLWDGEPHHVAATWTAAGGGGVFVDGDLVVAGTPLGVDDDATSMRIGCGIGELDFDGVIDEVRISRTERFAADFEPQTFAYDNDLDTIALWHLDTGGGTVAYEVEGRYTGVISDGEWADGLVANRP